MAWHEHIYEMSANPFLISFASLFHSVYHTYFTSITQNEVVKLDLHQAIVDAILESDAPGAFRLPGVVETPNHHVKITRIWNDEKKAAVWPACRGSRRWPSLCRRWTPPF
jgi:DNA-binding FadR family transcriptional regulator